MFKLVLEKAEEPEIKLPTSAGSLKRQKSSRRTSISALLTMPKHLTVFSSVQFSCSVVPDSLQPHELQHAKLPCPSPSVICITDWWPKYWSFSFSISPSNEYSALISFRMDWLDLFAFQGTLESLLQLHSSKASVLWCSAFFLVQLTSMHDYWKNHSFD